jgi:hypothetical protein
MNTCWNCKHFTRTGGHGSSDWGWCNNSRGNVNADDTCDDFSEKEEVKKSTPVKIEIVKKKTEVDETKYYFMVYVYDNKGELIHAKWFNAENLAGSYAFEMEQYYKFLKED